MSYGIKAGVGIYSHLNIYTAGDFQRTCFSGKSTATLIKYITVNQTTETKRIGSRARLKGTAGLQIAVNNDIRGEVIIHHPASAYGKIIKFQRGAAIGSAHGLRTGAVKLNADAIAVVIKGTSGIDGIITTHLNQAATGTIVKRTVDGQRPAYGKLIGIGIKAAGSINGQ